VKRSRIAGVGLFANRDFQRQDGEEGEILTRNLVNNSKWTGCQMKKHKGVFSNEARGTQKANAYVTAKKSSGITENASRTLGPDFRS